MSSYSRMSPEERREYNRAAQQRSRARTSGGVSAEPRRKSSGRPPQDKNELVENAGEVFSAGAPSARPTEQMMAEAMRRRFADMTITATLMGDPPPGQSALDRNRARVSKRA